MFRRGNEGIAVAASIRMNDGAILIGTINCDVSFIEYMSKDGQQRFVSHHQIASIEPLATMADPKMPPVAEDAEPFQLLGLTSEDSLEHALATFQAKLHMYSPERWTGADVPFEFTRHAAEKTRQINMAFTVVRAAIQQKIEARKAAMAGRPMFGAARGAA
jgi:hypothetical protein